MYCIIVGLARNFCGMLKSKWCIAKCAAYFVKYAPFFALWRVFFAVYSVLWSDCVLVFAAICDVQSFSEGFYTFTGCTLFNLSAAHPVMWSLPRVPYIFSQCIVKLMYPPICSLPGNSECPQCSLCYSVLTVVKNTVSAFRWAQSRLCNWELLAGAFKQMMMMRQKFDKWRKHILPDIRICWRSWKVSNFAFSVKFWYLDSFKASIICCLKNKEKNQSKLKTFLHLR